MSSEKIKKQYSSAIDHHTRVMNAFYDRIDNVHKRQLHQGQIKVAKEYFSNEKKIIQSQWGRNTGKTETALFIACVKAVLDPKSLIYIICPERKQGKEIYWSSKRLQNYAPPEFIEDARDSELRLVFNNGSFILIDGCENAPTHAGIKPTLVIYDEFQRHSKEFHVEIMAPNLLAKKSALLVFGTPPRTRSSYYVEFWENLKKQIASGDTSKAYYQFPTELNPSISKEELERTKKELIESGNELIWKREFLGEMIFGGQDIVFPKWNPTVHWKKHDVLLSYVLREARSMKWFTICDPGTSSCFAVLFGAYNPHTSQLFLLDEIYEKDRLKTDTRSIWERIKRKEQELYPNHPSRTWLRFFDEAAQWFAKEVHANFRECLNPTEKYKRDQETDISLIKMLMAQENALSVSDRCYWLRWELESYVTDEKGNYPDINDHLVDCFRYLVSAANFTLGESVQTGAFIETSSEYSAPRVGQRFIGKGDDWANLVVSDSLSVDEKDIFNQVKNSYDGFFH